MSVVVETLPEERFVFEMGQLTFEIVIAMGHALDVQKRLVLLVIKKPELLEILLPHNSRGASRYC